MAEQEDQKEELEVPMEELGVRKGEKAVPREERLAQTGEREVPMEELVAYMEEQAVPMEERRVQTGEHKVLMEESGARTGEQEIPMEEHQAQTEEQEVQTERRDNKTGRSDAEAVAAVEVSRLASLCPAGSRRRAGPAGSRHRAGPEEGCQADSMHGRHRAGRCRGSDPHRLWPCWQRQRSAQASG